MMRAARSSIRRYSATRIGSAAGRRSPARRTRTGATARMSVACNGDVAEALDQTHVSTSQIIARSGPCGSTPSELERRGVIRPCSGRGSRGPDRRARRASTVAAACPSAVPLPPAAGEDLVDRGHRAPRRAHLGAATGGTVLEGHFLAGVDHVVDPVDVGQQFLAGGVDVGGGLTDGVHDVRVVLDRDAVRRRRGRAGNPGAAASAPSAMPMVAEEMPSGNIVDHGIR